MSYTSKQPVKDSESVQKVANTAMAPTFSDQRSSTAAQLKQQQIMRLSHSPNVIQQLTTEEDDPLQGEFEHETPAQLQEAPAAKPNNTGLPDNLKSGIENLSGYSMDDVKVHFNSDKPAQLNAHAYAQGSDIHVAPGQEQHLPHEAWHVVQQKQGRVKPNIQMKAGVLLNNDHALETEADVMGDRASAIGKNTMPSSVATVAASSSNTIQAMTGFEAELHVPVYAAASDERAPAIVKEDTPLSGSERTAIKDFLAGGLVYGRAYAFDPDGYYDVSADHDPYRNVHKKLIEELIASGYIPATFFARDMTNVEYRTPPVEERKPGADGLMSRISTAVKTHAASTAAKSTMDGVHALDAPATDLKTGVPKTALDKLVSSGGEAVKNAVAAAHAKVDPQVYYQTTTGVLPSEIPEFFKASALEIRENAGGYEELGPKEMGAYLVMGKAYTIVQTLMASEAANFIREQPAFKSMQGWMTLLAQYMLSYQLERSDFKGAQSTEKNLVGYLSKTPLHETLAALPVAIRPDLTSEPAKTNWITLFRGLRDAVNEYDLVAAAGLTKVDIDKGRVPEPGVWLGKIIQGLPGGEVSTGNKLGLDSGQSVFNPKLSITGEQAIPLEDRFSRLKTKPEALAPDKVDDYLNKEWAKATARRQGSTVNPNDKTSAKAETDDDAYDRVVELVKKLLTDAGTKHGLDEVTLKGFRNRLAALPDIGFLIIPKELADITALHKDIYAAINMRTRERNELALKWIDATYNTILYHWKDAKNFRPQLEIVDADVYVKKGEAWVKTTVEGSYRIFQNDSGNSKIERRIENVVTYLAADGKSWIA